MVISLVDNNNLIIEPYTYKENCSNHFKKDFKDANYDFNTSNFQK